ncbi:MAG: bacteriohemerythrin [Deltaproteobacteria bacterium]|nr:bacteriohemerythrin [Deltaproteobacteria bacterium]
MAFIQWSDDLSVGVSKIDQQHRELVRMVNQLHDAMSQGKSKDVLGGLLEELAGYTVQHFQTEEQLFDTHSFPAAEAHKKAHAELTQEVVSFKQRFDKGEVMLSVQLMNFLKNWLVDHIQGDDMNAGDFLASRGMS